MSWKERIEFVYKKIIKFASIFYKIRTNLNVHSSMIPLHTAVNIQHQLIHLPCIKNVVFCICTFHLLYGIEIYGNANPTNINRLKILNNKILRIPKPDPGVLTSLTCTNVTHTSYRLTS